MSDTVATESAKLPTSMHGSTIPRERSKDMVLRQVGWIGHRDGTVYALGDNPLGDGREKGGVSPLYGTIGVWRDWDGDGRYVIED